MISKFSVKKPYTVLVGVVLAIVLGVVSFTRMTTDLLPSISLPYVIVMTTYPGASPETVESAVTQPVEASMATVSNIESIRSISSENYSMVILEFAQSTDMNAVSLEIRESLDQIKSYWNDSVGNPIIMKLNPDMLPVMIAAVGVEGMDYGEISTYVQNSIMPDLESTEGVASVSASGLLEESVNVIIRQEKIDEVNRLVRASIDEKMKDAAEGIANGKKAIEDGKKEIAAGKEALEAGKQALEAGAAGAAGFPGGAAGTAGFPGGAAGTAGLSGDAAGAAGLAGMQMDLEASRQEFENREKELAAAEQELENREKELEAAEKELEDARNAAYEKADMGKILTVDTVKGLLTAQNFSMPAGYVTEEGISYLVRVGDKPSTVEELAALPLMDLHMDGVPVITLGAVADVFYTDNSDSIYTNVDGSAGVMLTIQKQTGYSTGEVSDRLLKRFDDLMKENSNLSLITVMDQGVYIDLVMDSIINNILFGGLLAIAILILFLKDLRPTIVVAFSIPISLVTAIVCMYFSGVTLNVISLSGLALGIGMLVDNSIVVIENIYRLRSEGHSVKEAAMAGAKEVTGAIIASTLTTVCVFLPIVFTEGITRQLFVDMGLTIGYSLLASLVIALTVVPAMSSKILAKTRQKKEGRIYGGLVKAYEKLLKVSLKVKPLVLLLVVVLLAASIYLAFTRGTAFMPDMDSTQLTVSVILADDATLAETSEVTDKVVEAILSIEDVENVGAMADSSAMAMLGGSGSVSATSATVYVVTKENKSMSNDEIADVILEKTAGLEAEITVDTSSMDMSAMGGSGISIQVRGRDIDTLQRIAKEVAAIIEGVEGTANVSSGLEDTDEELRVAVKRGEAARYGITVAQVFSQLYSRLADANAATTLVAAEKDYSVYVMSGDDMELTRAQLKELEVDGTDENGAGIKVPLSEIADFETARSLTSINRIDQTRYVSVSAAIADGYNIGLVSADVEEKLADYQVPAGYSLVFSGENEMIVDAMQQIVLMMILAVVFMYLIMVAQFQSLLYPFIILFTIPLAFTGGFLGLFVSGSEVSVVALIGFVMLAGIIVNNGIVLIDYMNQLRESGMEKREAIINAGRTRLRPVLMTALTTILALSVMVFSNDMGAEMAKPMAVVTIGGLFYGTLLTLVVIPCVYDIMSIRKKKAAPSKSGE